MKASDVVKALTANQIETATAKAYAKKDYDETDALVKATIKADIDTRKARYTAGVKARKDGFVGVPLVNDAKRTETDIRGKSGSGKKTEKQLVASAKASILKCSKKSQIALALEILKANGYKG